MYFFGLARKTSTPECGAVTVALPWLSVFTVLMPLPVSD
jgi:hypothetical protein